MARGNFRGRQPQRRKLVWARQFNTGAAIAAGAGETFNADLLAPFRVQLDARMPGITIVRIRLMWRIVPTASQSRAVVVGIRPYTDAPGGTEPADVPGPATDPHADWMAFDSHLLAADQTATEQRDVDVKSMRKLDEVSESLVVSFQAVDEIAAQVRYSASVLVALP